MKMKNLPIFTLLFIFFWIASCSEATHEFHVSPSGSDTNSGTESEPFATLLRARDAVGELLLEQEKNDQSLTVVLHEGDYTLTESLEIIKEYGGTADAPILWKAAEGEQVRLLGGIRIENFGKVEGQIALARLPEAVHDHVYVATLTEKDVSDFGEISPRGGNKMELFFNGKFMQLARYPNEGWLKIAEVPQSGEKGYSRYDTSERIRYGIPVGKHFGRFNYGTDRPNQWQEDGNIWMHGYWVWDWSDEYQQVAKFDKSKNEVYPAEPYHRYGYHEQQRFYFLNVMEELDSPGEWYLDRENRKLYFYPPSDLANGEVLLSTSDQPLIALKEASHITFEGLTFQAGRGHALHIEGGENNLIRNCTFSNFGQYAINIENGTRHGVLDSELMELASGGIHLDGGDRQTLTRGENFVENTHLHDYGYRIKTYQPAIQVTGVGNRLSHNLIHDAPHMAIGFSGNDHLIEYHEIYHVLKETSDAGAIYNGRDWTERGTVIRYNYFHDLGLNVSGEGFHSVIGVYFDDCLPGNLVHGNVFENIDRGIMVGGGQYNIVTNNVFIDCRIGIHVDSRGTGWAEKYVDEGGWEMMQKLQAVPYQASPWKKAYPELVNILDNPKPPIGVEVTKNITKGEVGLLMLEGTDFDLIRVENNFFADEIPVEWHHDETTEHFAHDASATAELLKKTSNFLLPTDFSVWEAGSVSPSVKKQQAFTQIEFEPIPFERMGLERDPPDPAL